MGRSSRNSSRPPSSDSPSTLARRGKDSSGRERGAQRGHEGRGRDLLPACAVDEVIEHWPECCGCSHAFAEGELVAVGEPARWQVEELPVMTVRVIEHRAQRVCCPACGAHTRATLPAAVARSAFGPRLQAAITTLSVRNRISRRDVVELHGRVVLREDQRGRGGRDPCSRERGAQPSRTPTCWAASRCPER